MATSVVDADDRATRQSGRLAKILRRELRGPSRRGAGGFVSVGVVITTVVAMAITLFGAGAVSQALSLTDGAIWLWDGKRGEATRVNAAAGQVDMRRSLPDARDHRVKVIQTDEHLLLQDLDNGTVTSLELSTLNVSGVTASGDDSTAPNMRVALFGSTVVLVDTANGVLRQLDAGKLEPRGRALKLSPDLVGGEFDEDGRVWVGSPKTGKAVAVRPGSDGKGPSVEREIEVGRAGHTWSMGVLDHGTAVVDRTDNVLSRVKADGSVSTMELPDVGDAVMPGRVRGDTVAITNPGDRKVVLVGKDDVRTVPIPGAGKKIGPAVAFSQRLYVPDEQADRVRVFDFGGNGLTDINDPGGKVDMENREGYLVINSVGTDRAWVIDSDHKVTKLEKAPKDVVDGEGPNRRGDPEVDDDQDAEDDDRDNAGDNAVPGQAGPGQAGPGQAGPGQARGDQPDSSGGQGEQDDPAEDAPTEDGPQISKPRPSPPPQNPGPAKVPERPTPPGDTGAPVPDPGKSADTSSPPAAPTSVLARAGDGSATISWAPADPSGSAISSYIITGGPRAIEVAGDVGSVNVTGLTNGTRYEFSVRAVNAEGEGEPTKADPVTPTSVVPEPPTSVRAAANPDGSITVSWQAPNTNNGTMRSYQLLGQSNTAGDQFAINDITSTGVQVPASFLTMGSDYTFTVVATLTNGASSRASTASNQVTTFSSPGAPGAVTAEGAGPGTVNVRWTPAIANGSPVTGYTLSTDTGMRWTAAGNATSAQLTGLPEGQTVTVDDLREFCRKQGLAQWKIPRDIQIVAELPRSPTGKVLKRELAAKLEPQQG